MSTLGDVGVILSDVGLILNDLVERHKQSGVKYVTTVSKGQGTLFAKMFRTQTCIPHLKVG